jgi:hypothetical protein
MRAAAAAALFLDKAQVEDLGDVGNASALAQADVDGLHVPVDEPEGVGLAEGAGDLSQHVNDATGWLGPVLGHQLFE